MMIREWWNSMGEQPIGIQSNDSPPVQTGMAQSWRPPAVDRHRVDETVPRRLEWIAVILFVVNFFVMMYSYSLYYNEEAWGLFAVAVSTATAVILLLSVVFSIFGITNMSRITLGIGIVGLMVSIISLGAKLMQQISEWGNHWML
jgi:ABC-type multidrug transport system permease subunit